MNSEYYAWIILALIVIAIIIAVIIGWNYLRWEILNPKGKGSDKATRRALLRYALPHNFKVLSNLEIDTGKGLATAENILIGFFGILVVRTCGQRAEYYGEMSGKDWAVIDNKGLKTRIPNPYYENEKAIQAIRALLAKNKIHNIGFENQVVMANKSDKTQVFVLHEDGIILKNKLSAHLNRAKFDEDKGVDPEKIAAVLEQYANKEQRLTSTKE